jgi:hypothetical protein
MENDGKVSADASPFDWAGLSVEHRLAKIDELVMLCHLRFSDNLTLITDQLLMSENLVQQLDALGLRIDRVYASHQLAVA